MPRRAAGPRLYLRRRAGRDPLYVIRDGQTEVGTGCGPGREREAAAALARYLADKHHPGFGDGDPARVLVADAILSYQRERAPHTADPALTGYLVVPLLDFWGERAAADVTPATCSAYVDWRTAQVGRHGRRVSAATARRELEALSAALGWCWRAGRLDRQVRVTLPPAAPARERWLTRSEAASLVAGALGWRKTDDGWRRDRTRLPHVARFVLLALYTGTRHEATLRLRWTPSTDGGWVDLTHDRIYRRAAGKRESAKRQPPIPIPPRLRPHLARWRRLTTLGPAEYRPPAKSAGGKPGAPWIMEKERRGFAVARARAGLGPEVTPHVLRHTCATWLLQAGVSTWEVAGYLGTSEAMIRRTYGHHATDYLTRAAASVGRQSGARPRNEAGRLRLTP